MSVWRWRAGLQAFSARRHGWSLRVWVNDVARTPAEVWRAAASRYDEGRQIGTAPTYEAAIALAEAWKP